jgi:uncharacterized protein DUF5990
MNLRLVLLVPPAGIDYGLQSGRGSGYETVQTQRSAGKDLRFEFSIEVNAAAKQGPPDFRGPVVQGPAGGRFVYIDIGTYAGQTNTPWSRRLKVPLTGITWAQVERASRGARTLLEARVPGTAKDGSPACASVKDFGGWKPAAA